MIQKTKGLTRMMKMFGENCSSGSLQFRGIYDRENTIETTDGAAFILEGQVLTVLKSVAEQLQRDSRIFVGSSLYQVREILFESDGETARLNIVEVN